MSEGRLRVPVWPGWAHHRNGWRYATKGLRRLHSEAGVRFFGSLEDHFADPSTPAISRPFVGFFHTIPHHPDAVGKKYREYPDLHSILSSERWHEEEPHCLGLFTVSPYVAEWLRAHVAVPVSPVFHPAPETSLPFEMDAFRQAEPRRVVHIGQWLRRTETFFALDCPGYQKILLDTLGIHDWAHINTSVSDEQRKTVEVLAPLSHAHFDALLSRSVAFVDLYDAGACNTVLDCIRSGTPLLVNRLPGVEDYLGADYPLYWDTLEGAAALLADQEALAAASQHLRSLDIHVRLSLDAFVDAVRASEVYQALPPPASAATG